MSSKLKGAASAAIIGLVILVVLFQTYAVVVPTAGVAGDKMTDEGRCTASGCGFNESYLPDDGINCYNDTSIFNSTDTGTCSDQGIPLGNLFSSTGVVFVIVMAALLMLVIFAFMPKGKMPKGKK